MGTIVNTHREAVVKEAGREKRREEDTELERRLSG